MSKPSIKRRRWSDRTRMLLFLELALVLPAAALVGFSISHLKTVQRDRGIEAAIQRDFARMLKISEKRIDSRIYETLTEARRQFPCATDTAVQSKLDEILAGHPGFAHVFLYDTESGIVFRSQPGRADDPDFRKESAQNKKMVSSFSKMDAEDLVRKLHMTEEKEGRPQFYFFGNWAPRGDKSVYQNVALMTIPNLAPGRVAIGGVVFDSEYLSGHFFPEMLNSLLAQDIGDTGANRNTGNEAVMMVRPKMHAEPFAASADWDGGAAEMDRNFEDVFPGLALAIKFRGTTIEALSRKFFITQSLILGGLTLLMGFGIWLTYRNVAREMALAKLKSDFVANVSHELRTPLALIRLYAETLEMGRLQSPDKRQEYYSIIRKESERLTALINNILDFSRIEAGRKEYSFKETNLAELVRATLDSYRYEIQQNGFAYEENIQPNLPPVQVDREAIAQSLLNLVNNAIKYSQKEKFLAVKLYRANGSVKLEVIDHGIGIPRSEQPRIFEKFYRASDPLVHNTKGSGLGLSLVRHIANAHGGEITVESNPGRGSKFTIALPVAAGDGSPGERPQQA